MRIFTELKEFNMSKPSKMQERLASMKTQKGNHSAGIYETPSSGVYLNRNGGIDLFDPAKLPASEDQEALNNIAIAIINAGYDGVRIDESRFSNGKYVQVIACRMDTYEGVILQGLKEAWEHNEQLPSPEHVLACLSVAYVFGDGND